MRRCNAASTNEFISRARVQPSVFQAVSQACLNRDMKRFAYPKRGSFVVQKGIIKMVVPTVETTLSRR
jgi:hypothetical protein